MMKDIPNFLIVIGLCMLAGVIFGLLYAYAEISSIQYQNLVEWTKNDTVLSNEVKRIVNKRAGIILRHEYITLKANKDKRDRDIVAETLRGQVDPEYHGLKKSIEK